MFHRFEKYLSLPRRFARPILFGLLAANVMWIATHMYMVSTDRIDPWKGGGYGMYTKPNPRTTMNIRFPDAAGEAVKAPRDWLFMRDNYYFVFKCRPVSVRSLVEYIDRHPELKGKPLNLELLEIGFRTRPVGRQLKRVGKGGLRYRGDGTAVLIYEACGETYRTEIRL